MTHQTQRGPTQGLFHVLAHIHNLYKLYLIYIKILDKYQNICMILHNLIRRDEYKCVASIANEHQQTAKRTNFRGLSGLKQNLLGCSCIFSAGDLPNLDKGSRQLKKTASREDFLRNGLVGPVTNSLTECICKFDTQPKPLVEAEAWRLCLLFCFPWALLQNPPALTCHAPPKSAQTGRVWLPPDHQQGIRCKAPRSDD
jgi:hypothetical protein